MPSRPTLLATARAGALAAASVAIGLLAALVACSDAPPAAPDPDASSSSGGLDGGSPARDAASDAASDAGPPGDVCEGACRDMTVVLSQDGGTRAFDRAQFGTEPRDGGASGFYVELHAGGSPACPSQTSPTPDRTFVLAQIPAMTPGATASDADGVKGSLLDFASSTAPPVEKASKTVVTLVALDPSPQPAWLAMDVESTLPTGTVKGHLYATFCQSLSLP